MQYILGVDGGNTKTDYFLFDLNGNFVDSYRGGTCSHEGLKDSFDGSYRVMSKVINDFLGKHNLKPEDIKASVFGLAGVDTPYQKEKLEDVITNIGFKSFKVINDSFLGIKAGTTNGYGVCSINGTGTSSGGIDEFGNSLQVGGIGGIVGDEAGGRYISRCAVRACYDEAYRFGEKTSITPIVMNLIGINDKYYLMDAISNRYITNKVDYNVLTIAVFDEANKGDNVAIKILKQIGENLARSAGGAVSNLNFDNDVEVVLAGSVWVKGACPVMIDTFKEKIKEFTKKNCIVKVLQVPPATGAIIWALEIANNSFPNVEIRNKIIKSVKEELERM